MLLGALGASLLRNLVTSKSAIRANKRKTRAGESTIKSGQNF